jgi:lipopolysaccharide/colanic/teichoic acid biosynthesis glycosyltransferase
VRTGPGPRRRPPERTYRGKATLDVLFAATLLVVSAPVIVAAGVLVGLTSRGPAVYSQRRLGRGGRPFVMFKLRTMRHDCERDTGPTWAVPNDPRVTPIGRVLRRLHLDELPQLWNVLRGEMSLIGPRPERPEISAKLRLLVPGYDRRLAVKPGITGLAQVFLPPDSDVEGVWKKIAHDRFYVARVGPGFDLKILVFTALKVLGLRRLYDAAV